MPIHQKLRIIKSGNQYTSGKKDLFAAVISLRYLLPDNDFKDFKRSLVLIISRYLAKTSMLAESDLLAAMGFPANWKSITRYKR